MKNQGAIMKKVFKTIGYLLGAILLLFGGFLGYMTITDENPEDVIQVDIENNNKKIIEQGMPFSTTIFNIGYAGLDKDQDFFMDGGKGSRSSSKKQTLTNIDSMLSFLGGTDSDFILLQEVDKDSTRSFNTNQYEMLQQKLKEYGSSFAYNYTVKWVPVPFFKPMGSVSSGIGTFSKYEIEQAIRYQLPGKESWPVQLFELDRCILETKIPVDNGKFLRMVNIHLSAYDKGGIIRKQQVEFLKKYMNEHYQNGDYIVLGGDWNQLLSDVQLNDPKFMEEWPDWLVELPDNFSDGGFQWAVDPNVWTVRDDVKSYVPGENFVTIIDGFLVSPNIEIVDVKGHDLGFEHSDHNPVTTTLILK